MKWDESVIVAPASLTNSYPLIPGTTIPRQNQMGQNRDASLATRGAETECYQI